MIHRTIAVPLRPKPISIFLCRTASTVAAVIALVAPATAATFTCSTVAACVLANNVSTSTKGPAIVGLSQGGDGIVGKTSVASTLQSAARSGLAGFDLSPGSVYNSGVFGYSASGTGVHGSTYNGNGVLAIASGLNGVAVNAKSENIGLQAVVRNPDPGYSTGPFGAFISASSVHGTDTGLFVGASGVGIYAEASNDAIDASTTGAGSAAIHGTTYASTGAGIFAYAFEKSAVPLVVANAHSDTLIEADSEPIPGTAAKVLTLDHQGNLDVYGHITASSPAMFETREANGHRVMAYAPRETEATIEDVGEAQLKAGVAIVSLASDFAQTLNLTRAYHVFITPEGENHGLYVAQKTPQGFVVRESGGGHSTMLLEYRVVGTPRDIGLSRLPSEESLRRKLSRPPHDFHAGDRQREALHARFAKRVTAH